MNELSEAQKLEWVTRLKQMHSARLFVLYLGTWMPEGWIEEQMEILLERQEAVMREDWHLSQHLTRIAFETLKTWMELGYELSITSQGADDIPQFALQLRHPQKDQSPK